MALSEVLRIGAGTIEVDAYGGAFTSPFDMGKTSEDGIAVEYQTDLKEVPSAQDITVEEVFMIAEKMTLKFALKAHKMENLAYSFGHQVSDIVDNSTASPKNKELIFGGRRTFTPMAIRLKTLQPDSSTLYDILLIFRGIFIGAYNQTFTIKNERYIPCEIKALGDTANSGQLGKMQSEYV